MASRDTVRRRWRRSSGDPPPPRTAWVCGRGRRGVTGYSRARAVDVRRPPTPPHADAVGAARPRSGPARPSPQMGRLPAIALRKVCGYAKRNSPTLTTPLRIRPRLGPSAGLVAHDRRDPRERFQRRRPDLVAPVTKRGVRRLLPFPRNAPRSGRTCVPASLTERLAVAGLDVLYLVTDGQFNARRRCRAAADGSHSCGLFT